MLSPVHFLQRCVYDLSFEVFVEVEQQYPCQGGDSVYRQHVNVLKAVCRHPFLGGAHAHEGTSIDIVIHTIDIGVGMVDDIVFEFPDKGVAAEGIEGEAHDVVDPFFAGITAMAGIVHDIEADAGQQEAQQAAAYNADRYGQGHEQQGQVNGYGGRDKDNGFTVQFPVAGRFYLFACKVLVYTSFDGLVKRFALVIVCYFGHDL